MGQDGAVPTVILRSLLGRVGAVAVALGGLYVVVASWSSDGYRNGLQALAVVACVEVIVWLLWWRPQATLAEDSLTVRNAWRSHVLSWEALCAAPTRWALAVEVPADATATGTVTGAATATGTAPGDTRVRSVTVSACQRGGVIAATRHERRGSAAREEYVTASQDLDAAPRRYRTHLDAADGAYLIDLYQASREEHLRLVTRLRRREQRLGRAAAARPDGAAGEASSIVSRWDAAPVAVVALVALALLLTTTVL